MTITRILVPTDFTEAADAALAYGRELARQGGGRIHLMHVAQNIYIAALGAENFATLAPDRQQSAEDEALEQLRRLTAASPAGGPEELPVVVTAASAAYAIVDYAAEHAIDLIVMGTHGRTGLAHLALGSVAERVVRLAPCPVLTVRGPRPLPADTGRAEAVTTIIQPA